VQTGVKTEDSVFDLERILSLVRVGANNVPQRSESSEVPGQKYLSVEIPADINALQRESPELAARWREATRYAFSDAIASGYQVEEFYRLSRKDQPIGIYLFSYGKRVKDFV